MKLFLKVFFASCFFIPLVDAVIDEKAFAARDSQGRLIINSCADLQRYANVLWRKDNITFQGFDKQPLVTSAYEYANNQYFDEGNQRLCQLGYITSVTPMGKRVCQGYLFKEINSNEMSWHHGYFRSNLYDPVYKESDFCRYVN